MQLKVALIQMDIALGDLQANAQKARQLAAGLAECSFILLPELWSTGYALDRAHELAEDGTGLCTTVMREIACAKNAYVGGSVLMQREGGIYNTFVLISPTGQVVATYDKTHLFRLMQEDIFLSPGDRLVTAQTTHGQVGLAICYDLRFPEVFRHYRNAGTDFNLLVAEWPLPRLEHWRTLVRARAIENQCYLLACNRVGRDQNNTFGGHSLVVDPWGEILLEADTTEGVYVVDLETESIMAARSRIPVQGDKRSDLY
ncbi:MAG: carbon-nitrogen family hydrolase [Firmicutes bacterium]|nr:carbon-nitrogen family hydrolase [Dethiobacter sp.]MBS3889597.1 carbon-nitrogen family hydrolase [Bacillota bacterium]MBS4054077.1 carbon-nitrogen family hydrolase [Thermaerobacter sp.]MBS4054395.1 carbon-nitrogen family hydrolase [Thermaerobacter sp.]